MTFQISSQSEVQLQALRWKRWKALVRSRGVRYEDCTFENFKVTTPRQGQIVESLKDYSSRISGNVSNGVNVLLIGPTGTGKDLLLMALARIAVGNDVGETEWFSGPELFATVRASISDNRGELELLRRLANVEVLMISDLIPPSQRVSDFQADTIYSVVDGRYNRRKPTWMSVNVPNRKAMEATLGVAVVDRLSHDSLVISCDWPTYRNKANGQ